MDTVIDELRNLGYAASSQKLKASDYGLPQRRVRYYFMGIRHNADSVSSAEEVLARAASMLHRIRMKPEPAVPTPATNQPPNQPTNDPPANQQAASQLSSQPANRPASQPASQPPAGNTTAQPAN